MNRPSPAPVNPVTARELATALPQVMAAPLDNGPVRLLCSRSKPNARTYPNHFTVTRSHGVVGDFEMSRPWLVLADGSPDPRNQVPSPAWNTTFETISLAAREAAKAVASL